MVRVTEAAAIAASKFVGKGDKLAADKAATDAMRKRLNKIDFLAKIAIGEGKKDDAPGLFNGEWVGERRKIKDESSYYSIACDPLEGTAPTAKGANEAISVLAVANQDCLYPANEYYMKKLAVGPEVSKKVQLSITDPVPKTIDLISEALNKPISSITVCLIDRPRHEGLIRELRRLGCRIKLIQDCDVTGAVATCEPKSGIDVLLGVGGSPEGVITAAAIKCRRGEFQGQLAKRDGSLVSDKIYHIEDLAKGNVIFCATGVTNGSLLPGVRYGDYGLPETTSILMRSESGTVRRISTIHGN